MFHNECPAEGAKPLLQTTGTEMKTAIWTNDRAWHQQAVERTVEAPTQPSFVDGSAKISLVQMPANDDSALPAALQCEGATP
jgi:hypothetical protein